MKRFYPDSYFHSVWELSPEFFRARGITHVIFDIDDTLVHHSLASPTDEVIALFEQLQTAQITCALISNNVKERAEAFNRPLNVFYTYLSHKPQKRAIRPFLERFGVPPEQIALVGDQIFTDVWLARRTGVYAVLVDPIGKFQTRFFYLKRALEKPILRSYFKHVGKEVSPKTKKKKSARKK